MSVVVFYSEALFFFFPFLFADCLLASPLFVTLFASVDGEVVAEVVVVSP